MTSQKKNKNFESKVDEFEKMTPLERREFLKYLSGAFALPFLFDGLKMNIFESLVGQAQAQTLMASPINMIEVNFRDQWDFGSVFVAPGIATNYENAKAKGAPLFSMPTKEINNFYLSPDSAELRPHLDHIAVMELGECVLAGNESIHGHEAGNPLRSPGRVKNSALGKTAMDIVDKRPGDGGNEPLFSSSPTPIILHNYYQKQLSSQLRNGILMRSSVRPQTHTFYHFQGNLSNAQVDRYFDRSTLLKAFETTAQTPTSQTTLQKYGAVVSRLLKKSDQGFLDRIKKDSVDHTAKLTALEGQFGIPMTQTVFSLAHTAEQMNYWKQSIPDAQECPGDDANNCFGRTDLWNIGEIFGYAAKLFQAGKVRSIGIDFNMYDVHTNRTANLMSTQAKQTAMSLARFITAAKASGQWEKTLIVMFTTDGSRSPMSSSTGENSKNGIVLAGGMIKGGYYGDIRLGANFTYHRPDDAGLPVAVGVNEGTRTQRVAAADIYKTIAHAAGLPTSLTDQFPDIKNGKVLTYMLRG